MLMHISAVYGKYFNMGSKGIIQKLDVSELFAPQLDPNSIVPWRFVPSYRNITAERGWRPLFYVWAANILFFYNEGCHAGFFHPNNTVHQ